MAVTDQQQQKLTDAPKAKAGVSQKVSANWFTIGAIALVLIGLFFVSSNLSQNLNQSTNGYSADSPNGEAALTQETLRIGDDLQCPICEGQSVAYSNSRLAVEMRAQIGKQLESGSTEAEIKQYFVDRYGEIVLREPPRSGLNMILWQMPFIAVGLGLFILGWTLIKTSRNQRAAQSLPQTATQQTSPEGANTVNDPELRKLLAQYDKELFE